MGIKVVRKTRNLEKLQKKLENLSKNSVGSGYFKEQGNHPETDITYSEMMNLHEYGFYGTYSDVPARPVRQITKVNLKGYLPRWLSKQLSKYLYHNLHLSELLDQLGELVTKEAQSIFGTSKLMQNSEYTVAEKGFNSPLVDSGLLMGNWSWKTTIDNTVKNRGFT